MRGGRAPTARGSGLAGSGRKLSRTIKRARRRSTKEKRRRPRLPARAVRPCRRCPPRGNDDDDADGPPLACGSTSEAAALIVA